MAEQTILTPTVPHPATPSREAAVLAFRRSPGHDLTELMARAGGDQVRLREIPFLTHVAIRASSAEAVEAVGEALGAPLSRRVGEVGVGDRGEGREVFVVWLSPDEYLAVLGDEAQTGESGASVVRSIEVALGHRRGQVVDVSANRTTIELSGPKARAVLDKTIELDLHPREFGVGRAVATSLESVAIILWRSAEDTWLLMPRASYTEHLVRWLADGMREFA